MVILIEKPDTAFNCDEMRLVYKIDDQGMVWIMDNIEKPFYHVFDVYQ